MFQLCDETAMATNGWTEDEILDQEIPYEAAEFFEWVQGLQQREKTARTDGDLKALLQVFNERARFFDVIQQPHYCHVKTASNINTYMWHLLWK